MRPCTSLGSLRVSSETRTLPLWVNVSNFAQKLSLMFLSHFFIELAQLSIWFGNWTSGFIFSLEIFIQMNPYQRRLSWGGAQGCGHTVKGEELLDMFHSLLSYRSLRVPKFHNHKHKIILWCEWNWNLMWLLKQTKKPTFFISLFPLKNICLLLCCMTGHLTTSCFKQSESWTYGCNFIGNVFPGQGRTLALSGFYMPAAALISLSEVFCGFQLDRLSRTCWSLLECVCVLTSPTPNWRGGALGQEASPTFQDSMSFCYMIFDPIFSPAAPQAPALISTRSNQRAGGGRLRFVQGRERFVGGVASRSDRPSLWSCDWK